MKHSKVQASVQSKSLRRMKLKPNRKRVFLTCNNNACSIHENIKKEKFRRKSLSYMLSEFITNYVMFYMELNCSFFGRLFLFPALSIISFFMCFSDFDRLQITEIQHSLTINQCGCSRFPLPGFLLLVVCEQRMSSDMESLYSKAQQDFSVV